MIVAGQARLPMEVNLDEVTERYLVYALVDPRTDHVRYIGKTIRGIERIQEHTQKSSTRREETHKARWIRQLAAEGLLPTVRLLEVQPTRTRLNEAEIKWIAFAREQGWPLTNLTDGGEGALRRSAATVAKFRAKMIGHPTSPETRAKISASNKRAYASPELRKAVGDRARGRKLSAEQRQAVSDANLARFADPAARARHGDAQRRRFAEQGVSEETRAKLSAAGKRRVFTEETRQRMREAWKRRRAG